MAAGTQLPGNDETIDLQQQVARLQALLEASRQVHSTIREEEVLEQVLRIVVRELEMAGAAFPGTGRSYGQIPEPGEADENGSPLPIFLLQDREGGRMAELVVAPPDGRELTLYEADFLEGLTLQAAVALENARNHKRNVEFARVQQDLDAARGIQRSLLPQKLPEIPGYSLAFRSVTCYEVGGDYLDIVEQPDGSLLIAVADVAGKGPGIGHYGYQLPRRLSRHGGAGDAARRAGHAHESAPLDRRRRGPAPLRDGDFSAPAPRDGRDRGRQRRPQSWVSTGAGRQDLRVRIDRHAARICCPGCATPARNAGLYRGHSFFSTPTG